MAIAGYGVEGAVSVEYWAELGADVAVFDERQPEKAVPSSVNTYFGEDAFSKLNGFDLVIRTAGLNPAKIKTDGKIWSATNEFFDKCPAPIIGVTGTKGKGTTCSLLAEILKSAERTVHLVGNIGVPALERLPEIQPTDIVVYELSSFQLWDLEKSPETAVVLMIEPDHMDVHTSMEEYVNAKANIVKFQTDKDTVVCHPTNQYALGIANRASSTKVHFMTREGAYVENNVIYIEGIKLCSIDEVGLIGAHNLENICAAITAAWKYTHDTRAVISGITQFKGLPHRLEFVKEINNIRFYNDSIATNEGSVIAALSSFSQPKIVVMGGAGKNVDLSGMFKKMPNYNVKKLILLGELSDSFASFAENASLNYEKVDGGMDKVVKAAFSSAAPGDVVLLSPGATSYDMFRNYAERGDAFKQAVLELSQSA